MKSIGSLLASLRWAKTTPEQRTTHARAMAKKSAESRRKKAKAKI